MIFFQSLSSFCLPLQGSSHSGLPPLYPIVNWNYYPIYFGSAICDKLVHPCNNMRHLPAPCTVVLDISHKGRYDLLQFNPNAMELEGRIPADRRAVDGMPGIAMHYNGHKIPGKTSPRLYVLCTFVCCS